MPEYETTTALLEVHGLTKSFGRKTVLQGLSFSLQPGEIMCVGGANASGKSTLLRCLAGLSDFRGSARMEGKDLPDGKDIRRSIGYLPQGIQLDEPLTAREILRFFARLRGVDPHPDHMPDGFLPPLDAPLSVLSGGQRQRVAIALALLGTPRLLLLDEPIANLDDAGVGLTWQALRTVIDQGGAALVTSPRSDDLEGIAQRVLILGDGSLQEIGTFPAGQLSTALPTAALGTQRASS